MDIISTRGRTSYSPKTYSRIDSLKIALRRRPSAILVDRAAFRHLSFEKFIRVHRLEMRRPTCNVYFNIKLDRSVLLTDDDMTSVDLCADRHILNVRRIYRPFDVDDGQDTLQHDSLIKRYRLLLDLIDVDGQTLFPYTYF